MKVWTFRFTAKQLQAIHSDHLGFVLASSHCCNELTCLSPYIIFEFDIEQANDIEKAFINLRFFTIVRMQIAKIFEYRDLCNQYIGKIRKTFPAMATKLSDGSREISRRINEAKWAATVRNKIAFHFDASYALQALGDVPPKQELRFIVGRMHGVTDFDFADRVLVRAMFLEAGAGNEELGKDVVRTWTIQLQKQITTFHAAAIEQIFTPYGLLQSPVEGELRDSYCAEPGSIATPLSTTDIDHH